MTTRRGEALPIDWMLLLPLVIAAVFPIAVTRGLGEVEFDVSAPFTFLVLAPAATFASARLKSRRWLSAILMLGGIAVGVLVDVAVDFVFFAADRNLFPFEIVYWWLYGALPIAFGIVVGQLLTRTIRGTSS